MSEQIDAIGVDKCITLETVKKQYGEQFYENIKKIWEEHPKERYYIKLSVEAFERGMQTASDCRRQLYNILLDYNLIKED